VLLQRFSCLIRYLGLALAETVAQNTVITANVGSWGGDRSESPRTAHPWFARGGQSTNGSNAGLFAFDRDTGGTGYNNGWRFKEG